MTEQDESAAPLALAEGFAPATAEQWWDLVGAVLRKSGGLDEAPDPATALDLLSTTTYDGVRIRPLYTAEDAGAGQRLPRRRALRPWQPPHRARPAGLGRPPALQRPRPGRHPAGGADRPRERRHVAVAGGG